MKNLDKYEIFKKSGFFTDSMYPDIAFDGYDKVIEYCYAEGQMDVNRTHVAHPIYEPKELFNILELIKQVKDLETAINSSDKTISALRKALVKDGEVIENLQSLLDEARAEIIELRKHNGDLAGRVVGTLETSPKSKFVITVEEF